MSCLVSDGTFGMRRLWRYPLVDGIECELHLVEWLMGLLALGAPPSRQLLKDEGDHQL